MLVAVNKLEKDQDALEEFAPLGFDHVQGISAEHGLGVGDLLDAALEGLPKAEVPEDEEKPLRLAIVGRPNVGKSSLLNRFLGEERAVVSPIPGTTRDAVDSLVTKEGQRFLFVDTAGIRKSKHLDENVDHVSVVQSRRAIDRADVALLVIDTVEGMREMDATIGGYVHEAGRGIVVVVNKWDLSSSGKTKEMETRIRDSLKFLAYAPIVFTSAKDGRGLAIVLKTAAAGLPGVPPARRDRALEPRAGGGGGAAPAEGREGEQVGPHPLRHADRGSTADVRAVAQPRGGVALFLPALPREPAAGRVRLRGDADRAARPGATALSPALLLTSIEVTHTMLEISSVSGRK